jgi:predicted  nucleic acid-binding Zn-ribbon protein
VLSTKTIVLAGAGIATAAGLALLGASFAGAEQTTATAAAYGYGSGAPANGGTGQPGERPSGAQNSDPSQPQRSDEQLLTGETADKVTAAAKAKEPAATIERVETDADGVYEAHMVQADGTHIIVQVGADFQVTNVLEGGQGQHGKGGSQPPAAGAPGEAPSTSGSTSSS